jgi:hypothetical protein
MELQYFIKQIFGDDEDRTPKNYFIINEQGHAASKKIKVDLVEVLDTDQD